MYYTSLWYPFNDCRRQSAQKEVRDSAKDAKEAAKEAQRLRREREKQYPMDDIALLEAVCCTVLTYTGYWTALYHCMT